MKTLEEQTLRVCGCCKRPLLIDVFYISRATGLPGNYCKECRKSVNRNSRHHVLPAYCLLPDESAGQPEEAMSAPDAAAETVDAVCRKPDDVNSIPGCCNKNRLHKKKEKERKENILPNPPCEGGDEEGGESSSCERIPARLPNNMPSC